MKNQTLFGPIPSVLKPDKLAYRVCDSMDTWNSRGNAQFSCNIQCFETYGDGTCQHSGEWAPQFSDTTDICLSVTRAILTNPLASDWEKLTTMFFRFNREDVKFALSVKFTEGKNRYYSVAQRKVTTADKAHDRRFEKVQPWCDGSPAAAMHILLNDSHADWVVRIYLADMVRDEHYAQTGGYTHWEEVFKPLGELEGDWHSAFKAYLYALQSVQYLGYSESNANCAEHNSRNPEPAAEAIPA